MYHYGTYRNCETGRMFLFVLILLMSTIISMANSAIAAQADTIAVIARHPESGERSTYQISFEVSKPIPAKAIIRVTFPEAFDLTDLMIAGSTTINGGFDLSVNKQVATIRRSGLGNEIPANTKVDVKFAIVKNPDQPADNYKIVVEILDDNEQSLLRGEKFHKILPAND